MDIEDFCLLIEGVSLTNAQRAVAVLWAFDRETPGIRKSAGELAWVIKSNGLGNPNQTTLKKSIANLKLTLANKSGLQLKPTARSKVERWLAHVLDSSPASHDNDDGFLPQAIYAGTRGYIEKIADQLNGCVHYHFFDGASVMLRRLVETLLIESYEHLNVESRIKDNNGNYFMLSGIINDAVDRNGITLGRESKRVLGELKTLGDRSAHNRRYNAVAADLRNIQSGSRLVIDELIQLASLRQNTA